MENIRDYILAPKAQTDKEDSAVKQKANRKSMVEYSVVFVSGPDFAMRRKTAKSASVLVTIPSQKQFYIKKENTGEIEDLCFENLTKFLADCPAAGIPIIDETGNHPFWIEKLEKDAEWRRLFLTITAHEEFVFLACKNLVAVPPTWSGNRYNYGQMKHISRLKELCTVCEILKGFYPLATIKDSVFKYIQQENIYMNDYESETAKILNAFKALVSPEKANYGNFRYTTAYEIFDEQWGLEGIRAALNAYCQSPVYIFPTASELSHIFNRYRKTDHSWYTTGNSTGITVFPLDRFVEYLFNECTAQGYADDPRNFWTSWYDYLDLQLELTGRIQDKYPEDLASAEKRLVYRFNKIRKMLSEEKFATAAKALEKYEYVGKIFRIISPKKPLDMVHEGQMQSNCVSSYVDRVAAGDDMIFFLRRNRDPEKSCVTIEVYPDGRLGQVKGRFNHKPGADEQAFVEKWYQNIFLPRFRSEETADEAEIAG